MCVGDRYVCVCNTCVGSMCVYVVCICKFEVVCVYVVCICMFEMVCVCNMCRGSVCMWYV